MRRRNRHREHPEPSETEESLQRVNELLDAIDRELSDPLTVREHQDARRNLDRFVGTSTGRARP